MDWSDLGDGPAGVIADCVLAYDVADYVRFRAVCRAWRRCCVDPRAHGGLDRRFHPHRWTMLREELAARDRRSFLNTSTGECVQVDIPELRDHLLLAVTPEGLLVLVHKRQRATVRLLNPLTRHRTELTPLTTLLPPEYHNMLTEHNSNFDTQFKAWGSGIANDDSTVVLCLSRLCMIGVARPGNDDRWTSVEYRYGTLGTPFMFAGRVYSISHSCLMVLETGVDQPPRLKVAVKLKNMHVSPFSDSLHLVNNCGELLLVHSRCRFSEAQNGFVTCYRVDLDTRTLFPVKSLGGGTGRAVFMGMNCSLSVSLDAFTSGSISVDTIYFSSDVALQARAYNLVDGSWEGTRRCKDSFGATATYSC